jgi:hypothetical protein
MAKTWKDWLRAQVKKTGTYDLRNIEAIPDAMPTMDSVDSLRGDGTYKPTPTQATILIRGLGC